MRELYVDDTIAAIPENTADELLEKLHSFHNQLKFTLGVETDNKINFLDLTVIRKSVGSNSTNWFIKPSASCIILNNLSEHSTVRKVGIMKNLMFRAYTLSDSDFHKINENKTKKWLKKNYYPLNLVNRIMDNYRYKIINRPIVTTTSDVNGTGSNYYDFPYIRGLSEEF